MARWRFLAGDNKGNRTAAGASTDDLEEAKSRPARWALGILGDKETEEVPGSILLLSKESDHNQPLGLRNAPARTSASSLPSPYPQLERRLSHQSVIPSKKRTADGKIILEPQPEDTPNDPLNWATWRRDAALLSLGFYCMVGGGMTPVLAAGFNDVATTYGVTIPQVALTTGLYMMGMGLGSVVASPTAILFGKRPVYLVASIVFMLTAVWCALSPNYTSLLIARIVQGMAVSPVECLPSATVAEIFFLHERAYRLGIYTLLLLGGKNLVPLVSAVIIEALDWRWVFWVVAMIAAFGGCLLFFFVPETFWDRTPRPHKSRHHTTSHLSLTHIFSHNHQAKDTAPGTDGAGDTLVTPSQPAFHSPEAVAQRRDRRKNMHVGFAPEDSVSPEGPSGPNGPTGQPTHQVSNLDGNVEQPNEKSGTAIGGLKSPPGFHSEAWKVQPAGGVPPTPALHNLNSPYYTTKAEDSDYFSFGPTAPSQATSAPQPVSHDEQAGAQKPSNLTPLQTISTTSQEKQGNDQAPIPLASNNTSKEKEGNTQTPTSPTNVASPTSPLDPRLNPTNSGDNPAARYTAYYRSQPPRSFLHTLRPWSGRLSHDNWFRVAFRPFILFAYPSVLWSTMVYSLSVGWLIVLSESVSAVYRNRDSYNFTALQTGLVYLSPFIGGVLGTAVAGKVSDIVVRFMSRRNGGIYEPEFRLVMAVPVALATTIGLMGFGWSAQERDRWIVPTVFFGVISFGCSLGSTTAITFCVDSYRQYAGEALVTLNFSKNIFHGLVFSLFFTHWLESDGPKDVFLAIGGIQMGCLLLTIPMYIFGKRARMWTVRKNLMEKF